MTSGALAEFCHLPKKNPYGGLGFRVYGLGLQTFPSFRAYRAYMVPFKVPLRRFRA